MRRATKNSTAAGLVVVVPATVVAAEAITGPPPLVLQSLPASDVCGALRLQLFARAGIVKAPTRPC